jgi:hypothetical protein
MAMAAPQANLRTAEEMPGSKVPAERAEGRMAVGAELRDFMGGWLWSRRGGLLSV